MFNHFVLKPKDNSSSNKYSTLIEIHEKHGASVEGLSSTSDKRSSQMPISDAKT